MGHHRHNVYLLLLLLVLAAPNSLFALHQPSGYSGTAHSSALKRPFTKHHDLLLTLRGGEVDTMSVPTDTATNAVGASVGALAEMTKNALISGPHVQGVAALAAVAAATVVPLTMMSTSYAFTVGYGASIATMSLTLLSSFGVPFLISGKIPAPAFLANASFLYGIRLAAFLALRNATVPGKAKAMKSMDKTPRLQRIPFGTTVAMLYAFMTCPVLYALRGEGDLDDILAKVQWTGVAVAYTGLILESVSDMHKYIVKRQNNADYGSSDFVGPTGGTFLLCRHPSYLGEVLFWTGLYVGGAVSFGKSITAWICATLGLSGIAFIMVSASKRLDNKQKDTYSGQAKYDEWRGKVRGALVPCFN